LDFPVDIVVDRDELVVLLVLSRLDALLETDLVEEFPDDEFGFGGSAPIWLQV
jgi:hypothetical protein